jgi:hypothetical protein
VKLLTTPDDLGPCQVYCEQLKEEVRRLCGELAETFDVLGLAGVDEPLSLVDAARSRMAELAEVLAYREADNKRLYAALDTCHGELAEARRYDKDIAFVKAAQNIARVDGVVIMREEAWDAASAEVEAARSVLDGAVVFADPRTHYVTIQVDRAAWSRYKKEKS